MDNDCHVHYPFLFYPSGIIYTKKRPRNAQPTIIYPQFSIVIFRTYMFLF